MRFSTVLTTVFAATALAEPIQVGRRQVSIIVNAFKAVNQQLQAFDTQILALTASDPPEAAAKSLTTASAAIISALNTGTENVAKANPIALTDALALLSEGTALSNNAKKVIGDLLTKKTIIVNAKQGPIVVEQLKGQKTATEAFAKAVTAKLPAAVQSVGAGLVTQVTTQLDNGIKEFSG